MISNEKYYKIICYYSCQYDSDKHLCMNQVNEKNGDVTYSF